VFGVAASLAKLGSDNANVTANANVIANDRCAPANRRDFDLSRTLRTQGLALLEGWRHFLGD
jgi:hypothetical protein